MLLQDLLTGAALGSVCIVGKRPGSIAMLWWGTCNGR